MNARLEALLWAVSILVVAWLAKTNGMSDAAAFGLVAGLSGAAFGSVQGRRNQRGTGCCR